MKKKALLTFLLTIPATFPVLASPATATGCEAKRQNIEQQLDYARTHDNDHRIAGLQKALSELNTNCTDEKLRAEREAEVREKELKVEMRRQELAEAQTDGRTDKINKKQLKLAEAQAEYTEAKNMLNK